MVEWLAHWHRLDGVRVRNLSVANSLFSYVRIRIHYRYMGEKPLHYTKDLKQGSSCFSKEHMAACTAVWKATGNHNTTIP